MAKTTVQSGAYGLMGRPESGYSMKVLAAMRYKGVPHQWMDRFSHNKLFKQHANDFKGTEALLSMACD